MPLQDSSDPLLDPSALQSPGDIQHSKANLNEESQGAPIPEVLLCPTPSSIQGKEVLNKLGKDQRHGKRKAHGSPDSSPRPSRHSRGPQGIEKFKG